MTLCDCGCEGKAKSCARAFFASLGVRPPLETLEYPRPVGFGYAINAGGTVNLEGQVPESVAIVGGALNASRLEPKSVQIWVRD